ncbi:MAG: DUF4058 family protein [Leptolyngbyaceae cyanobacterium]
MPSPFPGMDPYLEQPIFWSEFHSRLIVAIADALAPSLLPRYYVGVETRTYWDSTDETLLVGVADAIVLSTPNQPPLQPLADRPTVATQTRPQQVLLPMPAEVRQRYLEIREAGSDAVITVIEVVSPTNKRKGWGRTVYERKRQQILASASHLVEIDLLRADQPMAMQGVTTPTDYRILVSRSTYRPRADLYGFTLREAIPEFLLPLKELSEDVGVNLQAIVQGIYDRGGYHIRIDYQQPVPPPALSADNQLWVNELLRNASIIA